MNQRPEDRLERGTGTTSAPTPAAPPQAPADKFFTTAPALSLPKGGGAIRGIGEKFAANPVTGSSTFSIPLPASPGRGGFGPQLALSYDSGSGNGPFGFGWSLALPAITRKTEKGLPRYFDATDSDVFILSGAEDLVPVFKKKTNGEWDLEDGIHRIDEVTRDAYRVRRYRPRIEGLFARIERWTRSDGDVHWRSISSDNILSVYGKEESSRIVDPSDPFRIFSWLICETRDDKGNAVVYDYKKEDAIDLDLAQAHEQQRGLADGASRRANRYIHRIRYGNVPTLLDDALRRPLLLSTDAIDSIRWMFELEFDYGKFDPDKPSVVGPWVRRGDPFSTYRPGFEVRTYRLCRRVLMFHDFPEFKALPPAPDDPSIGPRRLVRSLDLSYRIAPQHGASSDPGYSFLQSATQWSYQHEASHRTTAVLADGPVGYWRLEEVSGSTTVADATSNHHDGQCSGGITLGEPGFHQGDTAALFDGATGRIVVPNSPSLNPAKITMEARVRWDGANGKQQRILEKESYAGTTQYGLSIIPDGRVAVELRMRVSGPIRMGNAYSTDVVAVGSATHIVATYDGLMIRIYLDGVLDSVTEVNSSVVDIDIKVGSDPSIALAIGNRIGPVQPPLTPGSAFNGLLDEVALFDTALTAAQVRVHHGVDGKWHRRAVPPVEFTYSEATIDERVRDVDAQSLENLPVGLGAGYQWIDLDGEGLSGILTEQAGAWFYKPNLGDGPSGPRFGPMLPVASRPSLAAFNSGRQQLMDVQGDGALDLVDFHPPLAGFQERDEQQGWKSFIPFSSLPNIDWDDRNLRFVDLTGDGHADALITEHEIFAWYPSQAEEGFGAAERTATPTDEREGPRIVFADGEQAIYLADMSGDGLSDIVRIRNGQICYWPNLGYGRFGTQVVMDHSPWFDSPDQFEQRRIRLADIDGSGTTDLFYLGRDGARLWFNRSGNSWSESKKLPFPVATSNVGQIQVADLMGSGTACLVWSSDLPGDARVPLRYLDLMGGRKPHLMIEMRNNLGAVTTVDYAASTRFYLKDKAAGTPWATRLPFPVHCVEKVTFNDLHRKTEFASTYSYHHGYFDGVEREFRGFGRVEHVDTQRFDEFAGANLGSAFVATDRKLYQPPVKTITWFHTGIATDRSRILGLYEREYFPSRYADRLPPTGFAERELPQPEIDAPGPGLEADEWREAMRACKGMTLRQEVVELEVKALHDRDEHMPVRLFSAAQHNCHIRRVQPRERNRHAVFLATESEAVTYHYELALSGTAALAPDPRVAHTLNLRFDEHGRSMQSVAAVYPRRVEYADAPSHPAPLTPEQVELIRAVQREPHLAYTETRFTDEPPPSDDTHRIPATCEVSTYELTGIDVPAGARHFSIGVLRDHQLNPNLDTQATKTVRVLGYEQQPLDKTPHMRVIEHAVTLYFKDDLSGPLDLGTPSHFGLTFETYKLALTDSLLNDVFTSTAPQDAFSVEARAALDAVGARSSFLASGYQRGSAVFGTSAVLTSSWWLRSGVAGFATDAARHFYLPERYIDPFGNETTLDFDVDDLFVRSSTDALGNTTSVDSFDHRVLSPARLRDANDNVSEATFDIRGLPVATALLGKVTSVVPETTETGDTVNAFTFAALNPSPNAVAQFFEAIPLDETEADIWRDTARAWLGKATARFVYHFGERYTAGSPSWEVSAAGACSIVREKHERDLSNTPDNDIRLQMAFEYADGAGQGFVKKVQAEPEPAMVNGPVRWIANGLTIDSNKGKPALQFQPYFSSSQHRFEAPQAEGVPTLMFYDAPGRLVRTECPDGTLSRVEFSPWFSRTFDQNDTILEPGNRWYAEHTAPTAPAEDRRAARLAALHASTPAEIHFDSLGREVIEIGHNRTPNDVSGLLTPPLVDRTWRDERTFTFTKLDAEGKPLWICDARGNLVMQYITPPKKDHTPLYDEPPDHKTAYDMRDAVPCYDIAGNLLFQHSMDAGERRMVADAAGKPMLAWDYNERAHATSTQVFEEHRRFTTSYDALHRPTEHRLRVRDERTGAEDEFLIERFRYGEGQPNDKIRNLRGQVWQHYDGSGLAQTDAIDLSGQPLAVRRRLASEIEAPVIDWTGRELDDIHVASAPGFDKDVFTQRTGYDALGRMTRHYNWHVESPANSGQSERVAVYLPQYNLRGALEEETLLVRARKIADDHEEIEGATHTKRAIKRITYSARGQKLTLDLGNDTTTRYTYDRATFRLVHLYTGRDGDVFRDDCASGTADDERPHRPCGVQNLHYHYDPMGNITHIQDDAQQTIWFANQEVEPSNEYVYDALYRLIEGTGRENAAMGVPPQPEGPWPTGTFPTPDSNVTRRYTQRYRYDRVGNIDEMRHLTPNNSPEEPPGWTRNYRYAKESNRLLETWHGRTLNPRLGGDRVAYDYDTHGSMLNLNASLRRFDLRWDWNDMIRTIDLGGGGRVWYQYGADKQRCRKWLVRDPAVNGTLREDRIYLGGYELYRRYTSDPNNPVEEIESHHLFEGNQRVLLVDDVIAASPAISPRPDGLTVTARTLFRYQYSNHLGSVGLDLDEAAQVISYEEFHPYGTSAYRLLNSEAKAPAKRYRYTGMEQDEESGLSYHSARCYLSPLGRWVSADPTGIDDGCNVFTALHANPTHVIDPSGLQSEEPDLLTPRHGGPTAPPEALGPLTSEAKRTADVTQFNLAITDKKSLDAFSKQTAVALGGQDKISMHRHLKGELGERLLIAFYETATRLDLDPVFLMAVAFGEGLNLFIDTRLRLNPHAKPDNIFSMGIDRFLKDSPTMSAKGYLPSHLKYRDTGVIETMERNERVGKVEFTRVEDSIDALGAMVKNRRDILEQDLNAMGLDSSVIPREELHYWNYIYYNAGSGPPVDPLGTGRRHLAAAAASARGLKIPDRVIQTPDANGLSLGNAQRVIGTMRVLLNAGVIGH